MKLESNNALRCRVSIDDMNSIQQIPNKPTKELMHAECARKSDRQTGKRFLYRLIRRAESMPYRQDMIGEYVHRIGAGIRNDYSTKHGGVK